MILILSVAALWCGAIIRDGKLCRNNAHGLLVGCHLRQHKWQKLKLDFVPKVWCELNRGLWISPKESMATLSGLGSVASALIAIVVIFK